jgi:predicted PurR-regulated permease PerM
LCFVSIFGGLQLFGFMGIFLGPVLAAFFLTILEIYREHYYPPATEGGTSPSAPA